MVLDRRPVVDTVNRVDEVDCFTGPMGRLARVTAFLNYLIATKTALAASSEEEIVALAVLGAYTFRCIVLNRRR